MNDAVCAQLRHIVVTYGVEICGDPRRVESLLRDLSGEHRREIAVLVGAAREGVPSELLTSRSQALPAVLGDRLARMLEDNLGMAGEAARWAVSAWASALGISEVVPPATAGSAQSVASRTVYSLPADVPEPPTVVVAQLGAAHHRTIIAAIKAAAPGTRILVRSGIYREPLVIDKAVELIADGPLEEIVIEATDGSCITMRTDYAIVRGFTLRGRAGTIGKEYSTVSVPQGRLVLEDCDVTSDSFPCVSITTGGNPTIRNCRIHDGQKGAIYVYGQGKGIIERCDMYSNSTATVEISDGGSDPILRECIIREGKSVGIFVHDGGLGTVEDCEIWGNKLSGVEIREAGRLTIARCKIRDGLAAGLYAHHGAEGIVENCEFTGNAMRAVYFADDSSSLVVRGCRVEEGLAEQARILNELGKCEEALQKSRMAIRLTPTSMQAYVNAELALLNLGRHEEALDTCDTAIGIDPAFGPSYTNRGDALLALGRTEEALSSFDHAIALNSLIPVRHFGRGQALRRLGRNDEAERSFTTAISLGAPGPTMVDAKTALGEMLVEQDNLSDAALLLQEAIDALPGSALRAFVLKGAISWAEGATGQARYLFENALKCDQQGDRETAFAEAQLRAVALVCLGDQTAALNLISDHQSARLPGDQVKSPLFKILRAGPVITPGLSELQAAIESSTGGTA